MGEAGAVVDGRCDAAQPAPGAGLAARPAAQRSVAAALGDIADFVMSTSTGSPGRSLL